MKAANAPKRLEVRQPILTNGDLEKIRSIGDTEDRFDTKTLDIHLPRRYRRGADACPSGSISASAKRPRPPVRGGYNIIVLSDRQIGSDRIAIPGAAGDCGRAPSPDPQGPAHLVGPRRRNRRAARNAPFRLLAGYGAEAINPYLAFERSLDMQARRVPEGGRCLRSRLPLHQVGR
jgi:glutamate synthase (NADPH/NADH) large chain